MNTRLIQLLRIFDKQNGNEKYHFKGMDFDRLGNAIRAGEARREEARKKVTVIAPFSKEERKDVVRLSSAISKKLLGSKNENT